MKKNKELLQISKDVSGRCFGAPTRALARMTTRIYDLALGKAELTINQFTILTAITLMEDDAYANRLAQNLGYERSTLSRDIERMKEHKWIESSRTEGKTEYLKITQKGASVYSNAYKYWQEAQEHLEKRMDAKELEALQLAAQKLSGS